MTRAVVGTVVVALFVSACGAEPVRRGWPEYVPGTGTPTSESEPNSYLFRDTLGPDDLLDDAPTVDRRFEGLSFAVADAGTSAPTPLAPLLADGGVDLSKIPCVTDPGAMNDPGDQFCELKEYSGGRLSTVTHYDEKGRVTDRTAYLVDGGVASSESTSWGMYGPLTRDSSIPSASGAFDHRSWSYGEDGRVEALGAVSEWGAFSLKRTNVGFEDSFTPSQQGIHYAFGPANGAWVATIGKILSPGDSRTWTFSYDSDARLVSEKFETWSPPSFGPSGFKVEYQDGKPVARYTTSDDVGGSSERYTWFGDKLSGIITERGYVYLQSDSQKLWLFDSAGVLRARRLVEDGYSLTSGKSHVEIWQENIYACGTTKLLFSRVRAVGASDPYGRVDVTRDDKNRIVEEALSGAAVDLNAGIDRRTYRYQCTQ